VTMTGCSSACAAEARIGTITAKRSMQAASGLTVAASRGPSE
jgi:hypothetical protein